MGADMAVASNGPVEIYYETFGSPSDPLLLLVMGLGWHCIGWPDGFCESLAGHGYQVARFDNRDCGLSSKLDGSTYTLSDMSDDTLAVLDAVGADRGHVFGVSLGSMIAQVLATEHPERLQSLTLWASSTTETGYGEPSEEGMAAVAAAVRESPVSREVYGQQRVEMTRVIGSRPDWVDEAEVAAGARAEYDRCYCPEGVVRQMGAAMLAPDVSEGLGQLDVPTLVIHGGNDTLIDPRGGRRLAELIPGARYLEIEGLGHDFPRAAWRPIIEAWTDLAANER